MSNSNYPVTVPANDSTQIVAIASKVHVRSASAELRYKTKYTDVKMQAGEEFEEQDAAGNSIQFDLLEIVNETGADIAAEVVISTGGFTSRRISGNVDADIVKGGSGDAGKITVGVASTAIVAADTTRKKLTILNNSLTETMYINIGSPATANDFPIGPGDSKEIVEAPEAAINGIRGGGADIDCRILEEND